MRAAGALAVAAALGVASSRFAAPSLRYGPSGDTTPRAAATADRRGLMADSRCTSTTVTGNEYDVPEGFTSQSRYTLFRPSDCPNNRDCVQGGLPSAPETSRSVAFVREGSPPDRAVLGVALRSMNPAPLSFATRLSGVRVVVRPGGPVEGIWRGSLSSFLIVLVCSEPSVFCPTGRWSGSLARRPGAFSLCLPLRGGAGRKEGRSSI